MEEGTFFLVEGNMLIYLISICPLETGNTQFEVSEFVFVEVIINGPHSPPTCLLITSGHLSTGGW